MIKTKNYELYFSFFCSWLNWALPLRFNVESLSHDYVEIELQILCFNFCYTRISNKFLKELDNISKGIKND